MADGRASSFARQQCRQSLDAVRSVWRIRRAGSGGVAGSGGSGVRRRRRVKTPPVAASTVRRRRYAPATSFLCRNAATDTYLGPQPYSSGSRSAAPPRRLIVWRPLHVPPSDTSRTAQPSLNSQELQRRRLGAYHCATVVVFVFTNNRTTTAQNGIINIIIITTTRHVHYLS